MDISAVRTEFSDMGLLRWRSPSWCFASRSVWPRRGVIVMCRIPDDCIDSKRYPLFMARAVLKELIESLQSTQGLKPC